MCWSAYTETEGCQKAQRHHDDALLRIPSRQRQPCSIMPAHQVHIVLSNTCRTHFDLEFPPRSLQLGCHKPSPCAWLRAVRRLCEVQSCQSSKSDIPKQASSVRKAVFLALAVNDHCSPIAFRQLHEALNSTHLNHQTKLQWAVLSWFGYEFVLPT